MKTLLLLSLLFLGGTVFAEPLPFPVIIAPRPTGPAVQPALPSGPSLTPSLQVTPAPTPAHPAAAIRAVAVAIHVPVAAVPVRR